MRTSPLLLAALALGALGQPALAQAKTKSAPATQSQEVTALGLLDLCKPLALGEPGAEALATAQGWANLGNDPESIYVETFEAELVRDNDTFNILVIDETYPDGELGYCRIDNYETAGPFGLDEIDGLEETLGELTSEDGGLYGSWSWGEGDVHFLLLAHEADGSFVLQLTALRE